MGVVCLHGAGAHLACTKEPDRNELLGMQRFDVENVKEQSKRRWKESRKINVDKKNEGVELFSNHERKGAKKRLAGFG